ncbi:expressed unknown protein [Seminavis robusta]|uniref:Uncharacterized protein n=1 Tax=Seminavis robusta TaxID=568900 RepID=A0A9N8EQL9_9STRA|nr:expressed unknown protein [Seminavis robusta]|eukprot:Sro1405_g269810.1 n/a (195) ;mRNA; f:13297-13881
MAEALETSSPATLALAKANATTMMKKSSPLKRTAWAASDSLQSMLAMKHLELVKAKKAVVESEEDNVSFPSIGWNLDEDLTAPIGSVSPINPLSEALALLKETEAPQPQAKRRRMGEPSGMVRSKAMTSQLSSLVHSCSHESKFSTLKPLPKFMIGNWGSIVTAREVTSDLATCSLKTTSAFVDTTNSLLAVHA